MLQKCGASRNAMIYFCLVYGNLWDLERNLDLHAFPKHILMDSQTLDLWNSQSRGTIPPNSPLSRQSLCPPESSRAAHAKPGQASRSSRILPTGDLSQQKYPGFGSRVWNLAKCTPKNSGIIQPVNFTSCSDPNGRGFAEFRTVQQTFSPTSQHLPASRG